MWFTQWVEVDDPADAGHLTVLGVDLNATGSFAVTSTAAFLGSADYLTHVREQYERTRGGLQQTGTESAHRTIESIGQRFGRFSEDYLHRVSKRIVQEAADHDCTAIAFEDLTDIRERIAHDFSRGSLTVRSSNSARRDPAPLVATFTSRRSPSNRRGLVTSSPGERPARAETTPSSRIVSRLMWTFSVR